MKKVLLILACGIATQLSYARICLIGRRNRKLHDALARFAFRLVHLNPICATFQRPGFRTGNGNSLLAALVRERQGLRTDRNRLRSRHLTNRQFHTRCLRVSQREFSFPRSTRIGVCLKSEFICTDRQIVQPKSKAGNKAMITTVMARFESIQS